MHYSNCEFQLTIRAAAQFCLPWKRIVFACLMLATAASPGLTSGANLIKGSVEGQPLHQAATPLEGIRLEAFNSAGAERDAGQSDRSGGFTLKLSTEDSLYRLIVWDEFNRWWGREISELHNDGKHSNLGSIILRPQTAGLNDSEKREQNSIIGWLKRHNPLSAAVMELHLGAFDQSGQPSPVQITGFGSAAYPLEVAWSAAYHEQHPDVLVNLQASGAGSGIREMTAGTVDFGSRDTALTDAQLSGLKLRLRQFPVALGAAVVVYSEKLPAGLRLSGAVLAKIYLGEIRTWNDRELAAINPGKELPNLRVTPIHRADPSGLTGVLTRYLSGSSSVWKEVEGSSGQIKWKAGSGARGDEGVAAMVGETEGAVGYVDFGFAQRNHLRTAFVENAKERFITASPESISAAAAGAGTIPDLREALTRPISSEAYPLSSAKWIVSPVNADDPRKTVVLLDYINFSLMQSKSKARELGYVPLPPSLEAAIRRELNEIAGGVLERASGASGGK